MKEIEELDAKFPTFKTDYITQYEKGLDAIGSRKNDNPLLKYMKADIEEKKQE